MTKAQLVSSISNDTHLNKGDVLQIIESFMKNVTKALTTDGKVTLVGFGSFSARERKAREGRNPRTGEAIMIPAARVPKFVAGAALKDALIIKEVKKTTPPVKKGTETAKAMAKAEPVKTGKKPKKK
ncbi:MAG: HU family DNA-binding protein [Nitrospirae bacterium]|nr:HU family DNA-binding protein [Nitrospirota bacterium]MBF0593273.1 HU family DNA-binding protein [Nitrospirota bacterium]